MQDMRIQELLLQFDNMRMSERLHGILRNVSAKVSSTTVPLWGTSGPRAPTEASVIECFGTTGIMCVCPDIVKYCELLPQDIRALFSIFFERINPYFSILDPELHTPKNLIWTSHFLFTVICSIASRYYDQRPGLYDIAKDFARDAAGRALIDGSKSVEVCQAYLLMGVYPVPKKKWAEDRSWLFMGVAIRMAMELQLNQPPIHNCGERERLNRVRTWLNCYCVDGSHAIQFGKLPMLRLDDYMAAHSQDWYKSSPLNISYDVHLCAYVEILIFMSGWRTTTAGDLTQRIADGFDIASVAIVEQGKLASIMDKWKQIYRQELEKTPSHICAYRGSTTQLIAAYLRLVILALGFQHSTKADLLKDPGILNESMEAARTTIQIMVELLYPTGYLRYAMQANFVYVSFAAAFLINLLRPRFVVFLNAQQQEVIIHTVRRLIEVLGSEAVNIDDRHTPALYSKFLQSLLAKHHPIGGFHNSLEIAATSSSQAEHRQETPPNGYSWPDIQFPDGATSTTQVQFTESEMDFSLSHFVQAVSRDGATQQEVAVNHVDYRSLAPQDFSDTTIVQQWQLPASWSQVQWPVDSWGYESEDFMY
ncbi:hypothetical protein AX16_003621 [Volvariella volvacea WC 439]|nr:hypothetical protein AX16_003621 [Volvariella volvacea WC 439]